MSEEEIQLTDIKWIESGIAKALSDAGVTVQKLAEMDADKLLRLHPFVGTINAWLLTSEAAYIMEQVNAGLWDPDARDKLDGELADVAALEILLEAERIRPFMDWPPQPRPETGKSVRVKRIEAQQAEERKRQQELDNIRRQKEDAEREGGGE